MLEFKRRVFTSVLLLLVIYISILNKFTLFLFLFFINFITIYEFNNIFLNIFRKNKLNRFFCFLLSLCYMIIFSLIIWIFLVGTDSSSLYIIIYLLSICALTDIGGFIFGKIIGGKKFSKISPNKTYSGVLGSFLFPFLVILIPTNYSEKFIIFEINQIYLILLLSLISQLGDLTISFFKRKAKLKDTGTILPGHGGILDRIDGILLALPAGIFLISI